MPSTELAMVTQVEKSVSYPSFSIIGIIIGPMVAVSAAEEPEIEPKNRLATIFTCARLPRIHPTRVLESVTSRSVIPPAPMISPARIKNGTAIRE